MITNKRSAYKNVSNGFLALELVLSITLGTIFLISIFYLSESFKKFEGEIFTKINIYFKNRSNFSSSSKSELYSKSNVYDWITDHKSSSLENWTIDNEWQHTTNSCNPSIFATFSSTTNQVLTKHFSTRLVQNNIPTGISAINNILYISSDSSSSTDRDISVYKINYSETYNFPDSTSKIYTPNSLDLISSINNGSGVLSLAQYKKWIFVGNSSTQKQLIIYDISNQGSLSQIVQLKLPGLTDEQLVGYSLASYGKYLVIGTKKSIGKELFLYNISNISSPALIANIEVSSQVNSIFISKSVSPNLIDIYISTPKSIEIQRFSLGLNNTLTQTGEYDALGGNGNGQVVEKNGPHIYLGRSVGERELYALKTESSSSLSQINYEYATKTTTSISNVLSGKNTLFIVDNFSGGSLKVFNTNNFNKTFNLERVFPLQGFGRPIAISCDGQILYILTNIGEVWVVYSNQN